MEQLEPIEPTTKRERDLRDRAVRDYAALQSLMLDTSQTFYAPGTEATIAKSAGTIVKYRTAHEKLDLAHDGLTRLEQRVLDEDRQDVPIIVGGWESQLSNGCQFLSPSIRGGWTVGPANRPGATQDYAPTERAFQQLISKRPPGHAAPGPDVVAWLGDVVPHEVVMRSRKLPASRALSYSTEARECYAMVSPSYQPYDLNEAASDLRRVVPHDARSRARYDGQRATVDVILQNPYYLDGGDAAGVGETHRVVLRMRTADDGSGGYHLSLLAERVRCINLTLLHSKRSLFHGTHRQMGLRDLAQEALAAVEPTMEAFAETWRQSWRDYWVDKHTKETLTGEESLRRIVAAGKFRVSGLGEEGTLDACLTALADEPGDSRAHVHNAMTAAAHRSPTTWATRWADETAEEQASALLYQSVRWLPEVDTAS
jgi:hypothetical protein